MAEKLARLGIKRMAGRLYYVVSGGVRSCGRGTGGKWDPETGRREATFTAPIPTGYLAFLDKDGDVAVTPRRHRRS